MLSRAGVTIVGIMTDGSSAYIACGMRVGRSGEASRNKLHGPAVARHLKPSFSVCTNTGIAAVCSLGSSAMSKENSTTLPQAFCMTVRDTVDPS